MTSSLLYQRISRSHAGFQSASFLTIPHLPIPGWQVDQNCTGEAMAEHFDNAVYRLQVREWETMVVHFDIFVLDGSVWEDF